MSDSKSIVMLGNPKDSLHVNRMTNNNFVRGDIYIVPQNGNPRVATENKIYHIVGDGVPDVPQM